MSSAPARIRASGSDGRIVKLCAGDAFYIPAIPHDSWVLGNEPYVALHLPGTEQYAARESETTEGRIDGDADAHWFVCGWANTTSLGVSFQSDADGAGSSAAKDGLSWSSLGHMNHQRTP
jgi:hypothetical protein